MEQFTLKVDTQGRVSLPARLRQQAGIRPGAEVLAFFEDGGIVLATHAAAVAQARRLVRGYIPEGVSLVDELLEGLRGEVAAESAKEDRQGGRPRKSA